MTGNARRFSLSKHRHCGLNFNRVRGNWFCGFRHDTWFSRPASDSNHKEDLKNLHPRLSQAVRVTKSLLDDDWSLAGSFAVNENTFKLASRPRSTSRGNPHESFTPQASRAQLSTGEVQLTISVAGQPGRTAATAAVDP
ncbi:hypothetical protein [Xanthomonas melonis]|uniref:hypothetical protein n=1 Tax=Xanthomonas melonis TaxID=56456 RepID=UPI003EB7E429